MTEDERTACAQRLEGILPFIEKYYPDTWIDFRGPMVPNWRGGLFVRTTGDPIKFKAMFGCLGLARIACAQVNIITGVDVTIKPPDSPNSFWQIDFEVCESEVCW